MDPNAVSESVWPSVSGCRFLLVSKPVFESRLDEESILLLEDGHCLRDHAIAACKIRNSEKVSRFAASSLLTLVEMVDADLDITFLPEMARDSSLLRNTRVKMYPIDNRSYRTIGLAWRKGSARAEEFQLLGDFLRKHSPVG